MPQSHEQRLCSDIRPCLRLCHCKGGLLGPQRPVLLATQNAMMDASTVRFMKLHNPSMQHVLPGMAWEIGCRTISLTLSLKASSGGCVWKLWTKCCVAMVMAAARGAVLGACSAAWPPRAAARAAEAASASLGAPSSCWCRWKCRWCCCAMPLAEGCAASAESRLQAAVGHLRSVGLCSRAVDLQTSATPQ